MTEVSLNCIQLLFVFLIPPSISILKDREVQFKLEDTW